MANFYRGSNNNGVGSILTEEALWAAVARQLHFDSAGTYKGSERLEATTAAGTFTFVKEMGPSHRLVTGTWSDLDEWTKGHQLLPGTYQRADGSLGRVGNTVPFSNGHMLPSQADLPYIRTVEDINSAFGVGLIH